MQDKNHVDHGMPLSPMVEVAIDADRTFGVASIVTGVPVIRSIELRNSSEAALSGLGVRMHWNPPVVRDWSVVIDALAAGERRTLNLPDIVPDFEQLNRLDEAVPGVVQVDVIRDGVQVGQGVSRLDVMARDQWPGDRSMPELLASFSLPNHPAVERLLGRASTLLGTLQPSLSLDGYQSMSRDVVWRQVSAIWNVLRGEQLGYAVPPASFARSGQKIRLPDRILDSRLGTCLDLTLLFTALLEQAGLRPLVLVCEGHAFAGVWLHPAGFADAVEDDVQAVRKRIASGELLVVETTALTHPDASTSTLSDAVQQARVRVADSTSANAVAVGVAEDLRRGSDFLYALDIHRCRSAGVKPLPSGEAVKSVGEIGRSSPPPIESVPDLPPLDPLADLQVETMKGEGAAARLVRWKSRLLDLSLRNRLLNFRASKSSLQLATTDLPRLENALADGDEFRIVAPPAMADRQDPLAIAVQVKQSGATALDRAAADAIGRRELVVRTGKEDLDGSLQVIWRTARDSIEEGGANTLFLALGMLEWTQSDTADRTFQAPILLVPVSLERQSVRTGYRLRRHDDEAIVNPTLLEHLRVSFELVIEGLDVLPLDEKGVDVAKVLQAVRLGVTEFRRWEVRDVAWLGHFSFTRYLMWKDLEDRAEDLRRNDVVRHLIDHGDAALPVPAADTRLDDLDGSFAPGDLLLPLLADSSQQKAVCDVAAARNLVLEGPPGTGKSQTITNLIANALAQGRSVLFVSEKMAALEVVHRRLVSIGLGPFCLELHSAKAKKSDLLRQLGQSLEHATLTPPENWAREAARLAELRTTLNVLVDALHRRHANGLTVHAAIASAGAAPSAPELRFSWPSAGIHDEAALDGLRLLARRMATLASALGSIGSHPLSMVGQTEWSPSLQDESNVLLDELLSGIDSTVAASGPLTAALGFDLSAASFDRMQAVQSLFAELPPGLDIPQGLVVRAADDALRDRLRSLVRHGQARAGIWENLAVDWQPGIESQHAGVLKSEWADESGRWWPRSWFGKRAVRRRLGAFRKDGRAPSDRDLQALFEPLSRLNEEDGFLNALRLEAQTVLGEAWQGDSTDWSSVSGAVDWADRFAAAINRITEGDGGEGDGKFGAGLINRLINQSNGLLVREREALAPGGSLNAAMARWSTMFGALRDAATAIADRLALTTPLGGEAHAAGFLERIRSQGDQLQKNLRLLNPWCQWQKVRGETAAAGLQALIDAIEAGLVALADAERAFERGYRAWWLRRIVDSDAVLRSFSRADHERTIEEFRAAETQFQKLTSHFVVATLSARLPKAGQVQVGADTELGLLQRELAKQRRHVPVRQLVKGLPTLLPRLKPCLLMSPLSVAQYLDAGHAPFDLVIFDEASQIPVQDAVGAIARGKQVVVVGDPKQLPPTRFFERDLDGGDSPVDEGTVEDLESILDECMGAGMYRRSLTWHYRSRHESLITFSNRQYYEDRLRTFPSPVTRDHAVRLEKVAGTYDRGGTRTNAEEAKAVVDAIETHYLASRNRVPSLGVVTFNQPQQALIERLLDQRRAEVPALDNAIAAAQSEPLFIKNLENVQGDERDLILFSITFGPDAAGRMTLNFGPLNGEGGQRRLNVAITRAREGVVLFSSIGPEQIDPSRVRARGVLDLRHYLDYARTLGDKRAVESGNVVGTDTIEGQVAAALRVHGFEVHHGIGTSGARIDLAVVDPRDPGRYVVAIECDGATWRDAATARDRDRLREFVLAGLGWTVLRVWSMEWWLDPDTVVGRLVSRIRTLASQPLRETEPLYAQPARPAVQASLVALPVARPEQRDPGRPRDAVPDPVDDRESLKPASAVRRSVASPEPAEPRTVALEPATAEAMNRPRELPSRRAPPPTSQAAPLDREAMRAALQARIRARTSESLETVLPAADLPGVRESAPGLPVFKPAVLRRTSSRHFNEPAAERLITTTLRMIISSEGPVAESVLMKKASRAWGFDRTGPKINQRLLSLIPPGCVRTADDDERFWWPEGIEPRLWVKFRVAGDVEESRRSIYETAREEIMLMVRHVLDVAGASSREDIARSVCRLVGMTRTTADAEARVMRCVDALMESGELSEVDGKIRAAN